LGKRTTTRGSKAQWGWSILTGSPFHCFMSSGILKHLPLGARSQTTTLATPLFGPTSQTCSFLGSVLAQYAGSFAMVMAVGAGGVPSKETVPLSMAEPVDSNSTAPAAATAPPPPPPPAGSLLELPPPFL